MSRFMQTTALVASLAAMANAHGRVISVAAGGKTYEGFLTDYLYTDVPADLIAWSADNGDNGFVDPSSYTTADIACHKSSAPGGGVAKVAAGSTVEVTWGPDVWPESHHGPVLDYLAKCAGDDCTTASPGDLSFFKIGEAGLNDGSTAPGNWASDDIIANNGKWEITIPETLAAGQYVLRHEIIALHSAGDENGAQNYPQCFNIEVTGSGSASPEGTPATSLYTPDEAGIKVSIYNAPITYEIPGPELWDGASSGGNNGGSAPEPSAPASSAPASSAPAYPTGGASTPAYPTATGGASASGTGVVPYPTEGAPYPSTSSAAAPSSIVPTQSYDQPIGAVTEAASSSSAAAPAQTSSASSPPSYGSDDDEEETDEETSPETPSTETPSYGSGSGDSYEGKPLPEGVTLKDLLGWVNYYLKKGFNAEGVHARDILRRV